MIKDRVVVQKARLGIILVRQSRQLVVPALGDGHSLRRQSRMDLFPTPFSCVCEPITLRQSRIWLPALGAARRRAPEPRAGAGDSGRRRGLRRYERRDDRRERSYSRGGFMKKDRY